MATFLAVNATKYASPSIANLLEPGDSNAILKEMYDEVELVGASNGAQNSVIKLFPLLPKGAKVKELILWNDDLGAAVVLDLGDSTDGDRYASDLDGHTAGRKVGDEIDGVNYKIGTVTGDDQILMTIQGAAATGTVKARVTFA